MVRYAYLFLHLIAMGKRYPFFLYIKQRETLLFGGASLLLVLGLWVSLAWHIRPSTDHIFLHYNVLFGVDLIGPWWHIFYISAAGTTVFLINTILGWVVYDRNRFMTQILLAASLLVQILLLIAGILLVFLNT